MGSKISTAATRKTKAQREQNKANRIAAVQMRKDEIEAIKTSMMAHTVQQIRNSASDEQAVVAIQGLRTAEDLADASKQQLDREGKPLTKSDLLAIIMALEPSQSGKLQVLATYSVADLNVLIRLIVYDPNRYLHRDNGDGSGKNNLLLNANPVAGNGGAKTQMIVMKNDKMTK